MSWIEGQTVDASDRLVGDPAWFDEVAHHEASSQRVLGDGEVVDGVRRVCTFLAQVLPARFHHGNYLTTDLGSGYDAAILIYEDYCALGPAQRAVLLNRTHAALRIGGRLVFDVTSAARFAQVTELDAVSDSRRRRRRAHRGRVRYP